MKIYTKTGDKGKTSLLDGARVSKAHSRLDAYGTIDELNSYIGLIRSYESIQPYKQILLDIQRNLMVIGSLLATEGDPAKFSLPEIRESDIEKLENEMDEMDKHLPPLKNFIVPGGDSLVAYIHVARSVCRRAERLISALNDLKPVEGKILMFINRLSDYLFILARKISLDLNIDEITWTSRG